MKGHFMKLRLSGLGSSRAPNKIEEKLSDFLLDATPVQSVVRRKGRAGGGFQARTGSHGVCRSNDSGPTTHGRVGAGCWITTISGAGCATGRLSRSGWPHIIKVTIAEITPPTQLARSSSPAFGGTRW